MSMAEVLSLEPFRDAALIAGSAGLSRRVENVTVIEIPEASRWGSRGSLVVSTLYSCQGRDGQCDLVARLAHNDAGGLAVHPAGPVPPCYGEIAEVAERLDFPVLKLSPNVAYLRIFAAVYGELLNRQAIVLRSSEAIYNRFTQLVVSGQDLRSIAAALHEILGNPVLVLDHQGSRRLAWGGPFDMAQGLARMMGGPEAARLMACAALSQEQISTGELLWPEEPGTRRSVKAYIAPIRPGGDLARYLVVAEVCRPVDEIGLSAIKHASTAVSFDVLRERAVVETERRLAANLLDELLSGDPLSLESLVHRGNALGMDLVGRRVVLFVAFADNQGNSRGVARSAPDLPRVPDALLPPTEALVSQLDPAAIIGARADGVAVLPSFQPGQATDSARTRLHDISVRLADGLGHRLGGAAFHVGVGAMVDDPAQLRWSYETARWTVTAAARMGRGPGVVAYDDLGFYQLAAGASSRHLLDRFVSEALNAIQRGAGSDQDELMRTLETFLDCRESFVATAERLFVHPNTVKYRMEKIRKILPPESLADADRRLTLHLALKLRRLRP
jgi:sugar diacid utilization regulator